MKYCMHCGNELIDEAAFCPKCGKVSDNSTNQNYKSNLNESQKYAFNEPDSISENLSNEAYASEENQLKTEKSISGLKIAAKVFMILGTVGTCVSMISIPYIGFLLCPIPLAWCLPMTKAYCKMIKSGENVSVGFKVCSLIFVNTVAGILMLCDNDN